MNKEFEKMKSAALASLNELGVAELYEHKCHLFFQPSENLYSLIFSDKGLNIKPFGFGGNFVKMATREQLKEIINFTIIGATYANFVIGIGWTMKR